MRKAQIWVETVIYTLIGLVLISLVLAVAIPAINEQKDRRIVEDSINAMNSLDNKILEVYNMGPGNQREISIVVQKGELIINSDGNEINFSILESAYAVSEVGREIEIPGTNLEIETTERGDDFNIVISRKFETLELQFNGEGNRKGTFSASPLHYRLIVENKGRDDSLGSSDLIRINIYEV